MKHSITVYILLLLATMDLSAQDRPDHLVPDDGVFNIYDFQFEYYSQVRNILFNGLSDRPEIRFLEMHSFKPENVLDMELDADDNKFFLIFHVCKKMIWRIGDKEKVHVEKYRREVDELSAKLIIELFWSATSKTRYHDEEMSGLDGINYYFAVSTYGSRMGTIWSPRNGSNMRRLVNVCVQLRELTKKGGRPLTLNNQTRNEMIDLISCMD